MSNEAHQAPYAPRCEGGRRGRQSAVILLDGAMALPRCGLYRTTVAIGEISAGRLVSFHNHGDPGPGVYLPRSWSHNRASFDARGVTLPSDDVADTLRPLPREGLYRVVESFSCCQRRCRTFASETLVQLGYDGEGRAILFDPTLNEDGLTLPARGTVIDDDRLPHLVALRVKESFSRAGPSVH